MDDLGPHILHLRRARGMSQGDLARAIGASRNIVGRYERSEALPSAESAVKLARALDVTVDRLLGLDDGTAPERDPEALARADALAALPAPDRDAAYRLIDALVRDARAREAYAA